MFGSLFFKSSASFQLPLAEQRYVEMVELRAWQPSEGISEVDSAPLVRELRPQCLQGPGDPGFVEKSGLPEFYWQQKNNKKS